MESRTAQAPPLLAALALAAFAATAPQATATSITLQAAPVTVTMPGTGETVTYWGYGLNGGPASVPGPAIVVRPSDLPLTVTLTNGLPEPTSLVVNGQPLPSSGSPGPVWIDASGAVSATGSRPSGDVTSRVRSFVGEAGPSGGTQTYTFTTLSPGTYQYGTGTHPGVQHQMGLYGPLIVLPAAGQAYPGVAYDKEVTLVLGETDARFHASVTGTGTYSPLPLPGATVRLPPPGAFPPPPATSGTPDTSPVDYYPRYFHVNGASYVPGATISAGLTSANPQVVAPLGAGDVILLRIANAGLKNHTLQLLPPNPDSNPNPVVAPYMRLVAEDGNPVAFPKERYSVFLPPGKVIDAIWIPSTVGNFPIQDRALALTTSNLAGDSGMQAVLSIAPSNLPPTANPDSYSVVATKTLSVAAPGLLANDKSPSGGALTVAVTTPPALGTLTAGTDGSFSYAAPATTGVQTFQYTVNDGTNTSAPGTVTIDVASATPSASPDSYATSGSATSPSLSVAAPGVLGNDTSPTGGTLTAAVVTGPALGTLTLSPNGSFAYWTTSLVAGSDSFTYTATDANGTSAPALVTIAIAAHPAPVAADDTAGTTLNTQVKFSVTANDTATNAAINPATVSIQSPPSRGGSATADLLGNVTFSPALNFVGTDVFTYNVKDTLGATSNTATVRVNIVSPATAGTAFAPVSVPLGSTSTFVVTLGNPSAAPITAVSFSDAFPAGLRVASSPSATNTCGGAFSPAANATSVSLSGGTIPANGSCAVSVRVASTAAAVYANPAFTVSSSAGPASAPASTVTFVGHPAGAMAFAPTSVRRNVSSSVSTLTITLTNPNSFVALTGVNFTDSLPRTSNTNKLVVANPSAASTTCGGSVTTTNSNTSASTVTLANATVPAGASCTVTVKVAALATSARTFTNTIPSGGIHSANGGNSTSSVSAALSATN